MLIPRQTEYYKTHAAELNNPKYHCKTCEKPLYNDGMLSLCAEGSQGRVGYISEVPVGTFTCLSENCRMFGKLIPQISLEAADMAKKNEVKIEKLTEILTKLMEKVNNVKAREDK